MSGFSKQEMDMCLECLGNLLPLTESEWKIFEEQFNASGVCQTWRSAKTVQRKLKSIHANFKKSDYVDTLRKEKKKLVICKK